MAPKASARAIAKVVFKPSPQSTDEYTIIVNVDEFNRWKSGDRTIPLIEVVDSFDILFSNQGTQGLLNRPSNQQLENEFGSKKDVDVVQQILEKGTLQMSEGIRNSDFGSRNWTMGSGVVDTRGKNTTGI